MGYPTGRHPILSSLWAPAQWACDWLHFLSISCCSSSSDRLLSPSSNWWGKKKTSLSLYIHLSPFLHFSLCRTITSGCRATFARHAPRCLPNKGRKLPTGKSKSKPLRTHLPYHPPSQKPPITVKSTSMRWKPFVQSMEMISKRSKLDRQHGMWVSLESYMSATYARGVS